MSIIFNGKEYAAKKKILLETSVKRIKEFGIIPHLATIIVGSDPASILYTNLKKKFIESLGCQVDIYNLPENVKYEEVELLIKTLNEDKTVHGIMVQLPIPQIISGAWPVSPVNLIARHKDVDGLRDDSDYLHPTSKAVMEILAMAILETKIDVMRFNASGVMTVCVVGNRGMVGRPLVKEFKKLGYIVLEANSKTPNLKDLTLQADAVISTTGKMNLITPEMVRDDAIVIDTGSPHGDFMKEVENKASFMTPVPGGVGPVTIACLAENLILASQSIINR